MKVFSFLRWVCVLLVSILISAPGLAQAAPIRSALSLLLAKTFQGMNDHTYLVRGGFSGIGPLIDVYGTLYFVSNAYSLWKSDGTSTGTTLVKTIFSLSQTVVSPQIAPSPDDDIAEIANVDGTLYFWGRVNSDGSIGLWMIDGTPADTQLIAPAGYFGDSRVPFAVLNGDLFYINHVSENDLNSVALWRINPALSAPVMVKQFTPLYLVDGFMVFNQHLFFFGPTSSGYGLWTSDGTSQGTIIVKAETGPLYGQATIVNGRFFFGAYDGGLSSPPNLWMSDGTPGGTVRVQDVVKESIGTWPTHLAGAGNGAIAFTNTNETGGCELWWTDGTSSGTNQLSGPIDDQTPNPSCSGGFAGLGKILYFPNCDPAHGCELWRSDSTPQGTFIFDDIVPGTGGSNPRILAEIDGSLLFIAADAFWRTDGILAGMAMIAPLPLDVGLDIVPAGGRVFFIGANGAELWAMPLTDVAAHSIYLPWLGVY